MSYTHEWQRFTRPFHVTGIPLSVKLIYTAWMAVWISVYWTHSGLLNFFWLCDVANFLVGLALWLDSPLLISAHLLVLSLLYPLLLYFPTHLVLSRWMRTK